MRQVTRKNNRIGKILAGRTGFAGRLTAGLVSLVLLCTTLLPVLPAQAAPITSETTLVAEIPVTVEGEAAYVQITPDDPNTPAALLAYLVPADGQLGPLGQGQSDSFKFETVTEADVQGDDAPNAVPNPPNNVRIEPGDYYFTVKQTKTDGGAAIGGAGDAGHPDTDGYETTEYKVLVRVFAEETTNSAEPPASSYAFVTVYRGDYTNKTGWMYGGTTYATEAEAKAAADTDQGVPAGTGDYSDVKHVPDEIEGYKDGAVRFENIKSKSTESRGKKGVIQTGWEFPLEPGTTDSREQVEKNRRPSDPADPFVYDGHEDPDDTTSTIDTDNPARMTEADGTDAGQGEVRDVFTVSIVDPRSLLGVDKTVYPWNPDGDESTHHLDPATSPRKDPATGDPAPAGPDPRVDPTKGTVLSPAKHGDTVDALDENGNKVGTYTILIGKDLDGNDARVGEKWTYKGTDYPTEAQARAAAEDDQHVGAGEADYSGIRHDAGYPCVSAVFVPDDGFVGDPQPLILQAQNDSHNPVRALYQPHVSGIKTTDAETEDYVNKDQYSKDSPNQRFRDTELTFTPENTFIDLDTVGMVDPDSKKWVYNGVEYDSEQEAKDAADADQGVPPGTGNYDGITETHDVKTNIGDTVKAYDKDGNEVGTYTLEEILVDDRTGKVTVRIKFTPKRGWVGDPLPCEVSATTVDGEEGIARYYPHVKRRSNPPGGGDDTPPPVPPVLEKILPPAVIEVITGDGSATGDTSLMLVWGGVGLGALILLLLLLLRRRRDKERRDSDR